jgi:hypothetical protein
MPFYLWVFTKSFHENFRESFVFCHKYFAKTKSEFSQNFREKKKTKTFVPTLVGAQKTVLDSTARGL